ncbi:MAG TPA: serine/threonine-protein kinase [Kofleriaceae bacterium]|nr:serine/threonine-protein kinase [Kofleriaceae bacterium]
MSDLLGSTLGPNLLEAVIADGGFGTVYRARNAGDGTGVAIKVLNAELAGSREALSRFEREVDVLRRVRHPGIVEISAVGRAEDGRPWFAMELLDGCDLERHIARRGRLTPAECLAVLAPVCDALGAAHDAGVIHRDVKASNVFLGAGGRVVLLDFGIAKLNDAGASGPGLTLSRQAIGSPSAMAPEQIAGRQVTARTDVYALGALLYHMLIGEPPFADATPTVMQYLHCHARRPRPSARVTVAPELDDIVSTAMSIDPEPRHAGPRELLAACRAALGGAGASDAESRDALAVRVEVRLATDDEAELPGALDDADAVWSAARAHFCTRGFVPAVEASESLLFVRALVPAAAPDAELVAEFEHLIAARADRHPAVSVAVLARRGEATFAGGAPVGGPLLSMHDW